MKIESGALKPENRLKSWWKFFLQLVLKMLEKLVQKFKVYSMKFHNCCQNWFYSIKKKREINIVRREAARDQEEKNRKERLEIEKNSQEEKIVAEKKIIAEEVKTGPMVSNRVVLPSEREKESKDGFEQALIERIATNPQDIEAYERLGDHYIESNNYEESLECFKYVLKLSPINRKARVRVRRLKKMLGK